MGIASKTIERMDGGCEDLDKRNETPSLTLVYIVRIRAK